MNLRVQLVEKLLAKRQRFSLPFVGQKEAGVWGQRPRDLSEALNYATKALKGFGGKQEFSPNIF